MQQQPMSLAQMMERVRQINADASAGRLPAAKKAAELQKLRGVDPQGRWWACTAQGTFLVYTGAQWVPAQPPDLPPSPAPPPPARRKKPAAGAPQPLPEPPPQVAAAAASDDPVLNQPIVQRWLRFAGTPFLALLPGIVCGGLWFLYTFVRVGREGFAGVDCVTPAVIVGLPFLLSVFRRRVDRLLLPLQKFRASLTPAFRWGAVLGIPVILGLVCSGTSGYGYGALNWVAILSILGSYILIHNPEVQQ